MLSRKFELNVELEEMDSSGGLADYNQFLANNDLIMTDFGLHGEGGQT